MIPLRRLLLLQLLLVSASSDVSDDDQEIVETLYEKRTINATRGSSVTLSCLVSYQLNQCDLTHAAWWQDKVELDDPDKYMTTVNETHIGGNTRHRQVLTEILKVGEKDSGEFHCKAVCGNGEEARGHNIRIKVQE